MKRYNRHDNNALAGWVIAGAAAAAAAVILGRSDKGREVARQTRQRAEELKDEARRRAEEWRDEARDQARELRERGEEAREESRDSWRERQEHPKSSARPTHSLFEALGILKTVGRDVDRIQFVMSDGSVRDLDPRKLDQDEVRFLLGKSSKL